MKIRLLSTMAILSCSLMAGGAYAAGPYIGLGYTQFQYDNDKYDSDTLKNDGVVLRAGMEFNDWIALEARGGMGLNDDDDNGLNYDLDNMYGGYLKLSLPLSDQVHPYIIGGYTKIDGDMRYRGQVGGNTVTVKDNRDLDDESYGGGIDVNLTDTLGVNLEYMRYYDKGDEKISGITVGLRSAF